MDIHVHLTQDWVAGRSPLSTAALLRWMDERPVGAGRGAAARLAQLALHGVERLGPRPDSGRCDRLIPFCDIDPRATYVREGHRPDARSLHRAGLQGLGEHKCGTPIDDAGNLDIFPPAPT